MKQRFFQIHATQCSVLKKYLPSSLQYFFFLFTYSSHFCLYGNDFFHTQLDVWITIFYLLKNKIIYKVILGLSLTKAKICLMISHSVINKKALRCILQVLVWMGCVYKEQSISHCFERLEVQILAVEKPSIIQNKCYKLVYSCI